MRQSANNTFKDGMNLDLHPIVTPNSVLTDNLNGTFITYDGNEFCLQNDRGNEQTGAKLSEGFVPIGAKEYNGVIYIVSTNNELTEIGTYPGVEWSEKNGILNYHTYTPLKTLWNGEYELDDNGEIKKDENGDEIKKYEDFQAELGYTTKTPITIEIQPSYDGSVNLILVADNLKPRIINSGFSVTGNGKYEIIDRNQTAKTNKYDENVLEQTELIRSNTTIVNVDLVGVQSGGQFKGGNYTFYIKFGDADYNQTDVVAESGIVSVFKGNDGIPSTISGTLQDERTDKMVGLKISGLNHVYSKIYIYFTREYSDLNGFRLSEAGMFTEPINMESEGDDQTIWLSGFEEIQNINVEELNVDYHTVDWARAEAQNSNMLFLGNIGQGETFKLYRDLKEFTLNSVETSIVQEEVLPGDGDDFSKANYYSTENIYYRLGYWPEEYYRFGIVYILKDGSTTPVFNMYGNVKDPDKIIKDEQGNPIIDEETGEVQYENNQYGIFLTPRVDVLISKKPIGFNFTVSDNLPYDVIGWFVVRQKRIPITLCQGLGIRIDSRSHLPLIQVKQENNESEQSHWVIQSFLSVDRSKTEGEFLSGKDIEHFKSNGPHILQPILDSASTAFSEWYYRYAVDDYELISIKTYTSSETKKIGEGDSQIDTGIAINALLEGYKSQAGNPSDDTSVYLFKQGLLDDFDELNYSTRVVLYKFNIDSERNIDEDWQSSSKTTIYYFTDEAFGVGAFAEIGFYGVTEDREESIGVINKKVKSLEETVKTNFKYHFIKENSSNLWSGSGILSLDPCVIPTLQSRLDGSMFNVVKEYTNVPDAIQDSDLVFNNSNIEYISKPVYGETYKCAYIGQSTALKLIDDYAFSNVAGTASDAGSYKYTTDAFGVYISRDKQYKKDTGVNNQYGTTDYNGYNSTHNVNLIRGEFTPYIGVAGKLYNEENVSSYVNGIYSIRLQDVDIKNAFIVRKQDSSEYYCVSKRFNASNTSNIIYGGDCYTCKVGIRILRNFIDSTAPVADTIVDPTTWDVNVLRKSRWGGDGSGKDAKTDIVDYTKVNISDVNAVDLGYWVTFSCLSSYNLGLRSQDTSHVDEMALLGQPRSFYPLNGASTASGNKVPESYLLNDGYSATVGEKRYNIMPDVPYSTSEFENRIMFSNVHVTDAFTNGYRTFQGVSFKDYDKQYGAITKLISWGTNLFIVMEHGLGIVPVNEKALMQTSTGEAIHIYGHGVLPDQMTVISQDFGSKYEHSVIRTPIGIYGVDSDARKIWRYSDKNGFETISDMKIESYLNDNLFTGKEVDIQTVDIRAHYNSTKGDVMFTFYNKSNE